MTFKNIYLNDSHYILTIFYSKIMINYTKKQTLATSKTKTCKILKPKKVKTFFFSELQNGRFPYQNDITQKKILLHRKVILR